ncbi:unnamed protein product [Paramecium octaurelia]|uniref:Uncharacterized protein n=1 Tax=Paramecium octaurelia TaxID=43137 RepID=A0A8S1UDL1_PAROT|nr:unnamed protein product [Paramecium octaurelia]
MYIINQIDQNFFSFDIYNCETVSTIYTLTFESSQYLSWKTSKSQPRTTSSYKLLEPKVQFLIIIKATSEYTVKLYQNLQAYFKQFRAFTKEVISDYVRLLQHSGFQMTEDLEIQRADHKHVHTIRPCFIPDTSEVNQIICEFHLKLGIYHQKLIIISSNTIYPGNQRFQNLRVNIQFIKKDLK